MKIKNWSQVRTKDQQDMLMEKISMELEKLRKTPALKRIIDSRVIISQAAAGYNDGACYQLVMTKGGKLLADDKPVGKELLARIAQYQNLLPAKIREIRMELLV